MTLTVFPVLVIDLVELVSLEVEGLAEMVPIGIFFAGMTPVLLFDIFCVTDVLGVVVCRLPFGFGRLGAGITAFDRDTSAYQLNE
jgi:hypothetical protein